MITYTCKYSSGHLILIANSVVSGIKCPLEYLQVQEIILVSLLFITMILIDYKVTNFSLYLYKNDTTDTPQLQLRSLQWSPQFTLFLWIHSRSCRTSESHSKLFVVHQTAQHTIQDQYVKFIDEDYFTGLVLDCVGQFVSMFPQYHCCIQCTTASEFIHHKKLGDKVYCYTCAKATKKSWSNVYPIILFDGCSVSFITFLYARQAVWMPPLSAMFSLSVSSPSIYTVQHSTCIQLLYIYCCLPQSLVNCTDRTGPQSIQYAPQSYLWTHRSTIEHDCHLYHIAVLLVKHKVNKSFKIKCYIAWLCTLIIEPVRKFMSNHSPK